ncbi:carbohydrate ABC transporter substrate-binding protein [Microbispora sp. NEAU-D428]|uniref:ABC transporter substrate-binding protein n=1 Tax=Microbispora sitophila TaxID=2771537 RepID=UPI00186694A7|nr:ABC transporter substrate-binding protein [Microbispora sitophila]MBE3015998.1 carbohydrate ABC transporter substrate-binding protein [Microbispora sitophila]
MTFSIARHRRRAAAVALPLATGLLLAACGGEDGSTANGEEPQTITLSYASANTGEKAYETLAQDYMKAHPGVTIKTNRIALNAYNQTLTTQMQAGNGPDVMYINAGTGQAGSVGQLGKAGLLMDLDSSLKSVLPEGTEELYSLDGKLLGVPSAVTISAIVYNDDLAKQNGVTVTPSSTLQDVLSQCGKVKAAGKSIFGLAGSVPQNPGIMAMEIASSTVYGPNPTWNQDRAAGKTTFAQTQGWRDALQAVIDLNKSGCFQNGAAGAGFDALTNGASQGKLFGFFAPSGATKDIMDAAQGHVKLIALPFPAPQGTQTYAALTANIGLAGNAKTKSPKLVQDFIKFSVSPDEAKKFADAQGSIPVGSDIATSDLLPQYQPIADMLKNKQYRPFGIDTWPNGQVYDALGSGATGLLTGQKTIDDVLKAMDAAWSS